MLEAQAAINAGDYSAAEAMLQPLWKEMPGDLEVFRLLRDCYLQQEKWDEAEHMIRTAGETLYGGDIDQDDLLHLFLLKKDIDAALQLAYEMITADPEFSDLHFNIGQHFKSAGFSDRLVEFIAENWTDEKEKNMFLARHYAFVEQDNQRALQYVQQVLDTHPTDPPALQYRDLFQKNQKSQLIAEARTQLSEGNTGAALPLYKKLLELEPRSATAQEYYLCTLAAHYFFPFRWYFYKTNFMASFPWLMKAVAYFFVMMAAVLYYHGEQPANGRDHLEGAMLLFTALVIPRYTLVPLLVQLLAFRHAPGYHLLKKPYDFACGSILLISWLFYIHEVLAVGTQSFKLFLPAAFMFQILSFQLAKGETRKGLRTLFSLYAFVSLAIALLSWVNILPDGYRFFIFAGWMPLVLAASVYSYYMDYRLKRQAQE